MLLPGYCHLSELNLLYLRIGILVNVLHIRVFQLTQYAIPGTSEYVRVFTGEVEVHINGVKRIVTPADGEVYIPKNAIHGLLCRKDVHTEAGERADPDPIRKMRFLHRLLGKGGQEAELSLLQAMRIFYEDGECLSKIFRDC
jgi:hypothetical protein